MRTNEQAKTEVATARKRAKTLCHSVENGAFPIELRQRGKDNFTVIYGLQVTENITYNRAASEYGASIMHAMDCEGKLDNREKNEA